jgi:hypothetical protein
VADVELRFRRAPLTAQPINLVFGGEGSEPPVDLDVYVEVDGELPGLVGDVQFSPAFRLEIDGELPGILGDVEMQYQSRTQRPTVSSTAMPYQEAIKNHNAVRSFYQPAKRSHQSSQAVWQDADRLQHPVEITWDDAQRMRLARGLRWQHADSLASPGTGIAFQDGKRVHAPREIVEQHALHLQPTRSAFKFQQGSKRRNAVRADYEVGIPLPKEHRERYAYALRLAKESRQRFQQAIKPPPGRRVPPEPPQPDPCYIPPPGGNVPLIFDTPWTGSPNLLFTCETHGGPGPEPGATVVVPIKRVYFVNNEIEMRLAAGGAVIKTYGFSMSLDVDSWTWSFNAVFGAAELAKFEGLMEGEPVELLAIVNESPFRLLAERLGRDRKFPDTRVRVSGRGRAALLDAPNAPTMNFGSSTDLTAQQLMGQVLTLNGVPIGWGLDFQLEDWNVPAGVWTHQGTYRSGVADIAEAAGGYLQPHPTDMTLRILPRYPVAPWNWSGVTPDFELPAAATTREGIDWTTKPAYNRVFVSGVGAGVLGQVTREGTAGDLVAPMVTHSLITDEVVARQRGLAVLADTGSQAMVSLKMQVLPETGIIQPGAFVRYLEGTRTFRGLVRSTSVEWSQPVLRQTIGVEMHG